MQDSEKEIILSNEGKGIIVHREFSLFAIMEVM